jgi:hypothetical protein
MRQGPPLILLLPGDLAIGRAPTLFQQTAESDQTDSALLDSVGTLIK